MQAEESKFITFLS